MSLFLAPSPQTTGFVPTGNKRPVGMHPADPHGGVMPWEGLTIEYWMDEVKYDVASYEVYVGTTPMPRDPVNGVAFDAADDANWGLAGEPTVGDNDHTFTEFVDGNAQTRVLEAGKTYYALVRAVIDWEGYVMSAFSEFVQANVLPLPIPMNPLADFTFVDTALSVEFTDTSTISTQNAIVEWLWDFGDESSSTDQNPTRVYAEAGTYTVALAIRDAAGKYGYIRKDVTVTA